MVNLIYLAYIQEFLQSLGDATSDAELHDIVVNKLEQVEACIASVITEAREANQ